MYVLKNQQGVTENNVLKGFGASASGGASVCRWLYFPSFAFSIYALY